jgi:hypothetical protein
MFVTEMNPARPLLSAQWAERTGAMPRYFFHVTDNVTVVDEVGLNLQGIEEARRHADNLEIAIRLCAAPDCERATVEITDEAGRLIDRQPVPFLWEKAS